MSLFCNIFGHLLVDEELTLSFHAKHSGGPLDQWEVVTHTDKVRMCKRCGHMPKFAGVTVSGPGQSVCGIHLMARER